MSDLDVIKPAGTPATFNGQPIEVKPLTIGKLPGFARAIQPIGGVIEQIAKGQAQLNIATLIGLVADHGCAIVDAVSIATGIERDKLNEATPDELIELVAVVLKVNADFFKGRLTPAILAAVKVATPAQMPTPGAGPTP